MQNAKTCAKFLLFTQQVPSSFPIVLCVLGKTFDQSSGCWLWCCIQPMRAMEREGKEGVKEGLGIYFTAPSLKELAVSLNPKSQILLAAHSAGR